MLIWSQFLDSVYPVMPQPSQLLHKYSSLQPPLMMTQTPHLLGAGVHFLTQPLMSAVPWSVDRSWVRLGRRATHVINVTHPLPPLELFFLCTDDLGWYRAAEIREPSAVSQLALLGGGRCCLVLLTPVWSICSRKTRALTLTHTRAHTQTSTAGGLHVCTPHNTNIPTHTDTHNPAGMHAHIRKRIKPVHAVWS